MFAEVDSRTHRQRMKELCPKCVSFYNLVANHGCREAEVGCEDISCDINDRITTIAGRKPFAARKSDRKSRDETVKNSSL